MPKSKSGRIEKFLKDYPVIPLVIVVFAIGVSVGYFLGQQKFGEVRKVSTGVFKSEALKKTILESPVPTVTVPVSLPKMIAKPSVVEEMAAITEKLVQPKTTGVKPWKPRIAFVIDDLGYNKRYNDILFSMDRPVALAILPQLPFSRYFSEEGKNRGFETILHLPLEPEHGENPGPGALTLNMSLSEIRRTLNKDLESVPGVTGVNNHMGSRATRDRSFMYLILKELRRRKLFFLDSMTHPDSVGHNVAFAVGIPSFERDVFLDNVDDFNRITEQIRETAQVARQLGKAIAIGHYRENTLRAIKKAIPKLEADGFEISTLHDLAQ